MLWFKKEKLKTADGNVAIMTAVAILPIFALIGSAVDLARVGTARMEMVSALESGVLAAASLTNAQDPETVIRDYIGANLSRQEFSDSLNININEATSTLNSRKMIVEASVEIDTIFLKMFDIDTMPVTAVASAEQSSTNVEIAMVLDVSSSMNGSRLTNLKTAATSFVDQMLENDTAGVTSINLIPFGGTVNIGDTLFDKFHQSDPNPSDDFDGVITDPSQLQYEIGFELVDDDFAFSDGDNCIEYHWDDFSEDMIPDNSRAQVPHFWKWTNFNSWCPPENSAVILNTNDADALKNRINEFTLSDGTGMDLGTIWAVKTLSPTWRGVLGGDFADRPLDYGPDTLKVALLMTDGGITNQVRPKDYTYYSTHDRPWPHSNNRGSVGNAYRDDNEFQIVKGGGKNDDLSNKSAVGGFNHLCDTLKDNGVIVFTIGFQISAGSNQDYYLENCATSPGHYFFVEGLNIEDAFDAIAAQVSALRVTG